MKQRSICASHVEKYGRFEESGVRRRAGVVFETILMVAGN
jgi:hypothetical protein